MTAEHNRLNGWKEIAAFLRRSVRTVQRWEREYGLPLHRQGPDGELIFAYRQELEAWVCAGGHRTPGARPSRRLGAGPHWLIWEERTLPLRQGTTIIGRANDADVQILLPSVSRHHVRIRVRGRDATIEDVGSRHGTWRGATRVNGVVQLSSGDEIRLGTALLVYRFVRATDTTF